MKRLVLLVMILISAHQARGASDLRISQVYPGGGGNTGSYLRDYIELFNSSASDVDISNYAIEYGSGTGNWGSSTGNVFKFPVGAKIRAKGYLLIECGVAGSAGNALPVRPDFQTATNVLSLSTQNGKIALFSAVNANTPCGSETLGSLLDAFAYGTASCAEGIAWQTGISTTQVLVRAESGMTDTDNNAADFAAVPTVFQPPRNSATGLPPAVRPTLQAGPLGITTASESAIALHWTPGNGMSRIVKVNTDSTFSLPPTGWDPAANSTYSGAGEQVVYNGSDSMVTVTGLSSSSTYWFRVFEKNGSFGQAVYALQSTIGNPVSGTTASPPVPEDYAFIRPATWDNVIVVRGDTLATAAGAGFPAVLLGDSTQRAYLSFASRYASSAATPAWEARFTLAGGVRNSLSSTEMSYRFPGASGVLCGTAGEDGAVSLSAPAGGIFTNVEFASYGTPSGTCSNFAIGSCHAGNSSSVVSGLALGQSSVVIPASNGLFGDPCNGTIKSLAVRLKYESPGQVVGLNIPMGVVSGGRHSISGELDALDVVPEANEQNNAATMQACWFPIGLSSGGATSRIAPVAGGLAEPDCDAVRISPPTSQCWVYGVGGSAGVRARLCDDYVSPLNAFRNVLADASASGDSTIVFVGRFSSDKTLFATATANAGASAYDADLEYGIPPAIATAPVWSNQLLRQKQLVALHTFEAPVGSRPFISLRSSRPDEDLAFEVFQPMGEWLVAGNRGRGLGRGVPDGTRDTLGLGSQVGGTLLVAVYRVSSSNTDSLRYTLSVFPSGVVPDVVPSAPPAWSGPIVLQAVPLASIGAVPDERGLFGDATATFLSFGMAGATESAPAGVAARIELDDALLSLFPDSAFATATSSAVLCVEMTEGEQRTIVAPSGVFTSVLFASYGTPTGSCGAYQVGTCHVPSSEAIIGTQALGQASFVARADNTVFGDPCGGTVKRLFMSLAYGMPTRAVLNAGPYRVPGGRHAVRMTVDPNDEVVERVESNNVFERQAVFRPALIARGVSGVRSAPPVRGSLPLPNCDAFAINRDTRYAWTVFIAPTAAGDDYDLQLADDYAADQSSLTNIVARSETRGIGTEFVVGGYASGASALYPTITRAAAGVGAPYRYEFVDARQRTAQGTGVWRNQTLAAGRLGDVYDVFLAAGETAYLALQRSAGSADLRFEVFDGTSLAVKSRGASGPSGASLSVSASTDSLKYTPIHTGFYQVVVYRDNAGDLSPAEYTLLVMNQPVLDVQADDLPTAASIQSVSPNPIGLSAQVELSLPQASNVALELFDLAGRRVARTEGGWMDRGAHALTWDRRLAAGVALRPGLYVMRMTWSGAAVMRRVVLQ